MKSSIDLLTEQDDSLLERIDAKRKLVERLVAEIKALEEERSRTNLAICVLKGEASVTSIPEQAPEPAPEPAAAKPLILSPQAAEARKQRMQEHVRLVLRQMLASRRFHKQDFFVKWNCREAAIYVRALAQGLPPNNPFMLDALHVSPKATMETASEVADAICAIEWPFNISKLGAKEVRALAAANLAKILAIRYPELPKS